MTKVGRKQSKKAVCLRFMCFCKKENDSSKIGYTSNKTTYFWQLQIDIKALLTYMVKMLCCVVGNVGI